MSLTESFTQAWSADDDGSFASRLQRESLIASAQQVPELVPLVARLVDPGEDMKVIQTNALALASILNAAAVAVPAAVGRRQDKSIPGWGRSIVLRPLGEGLLQCVGGDRYHLHFATVPGLWKGNQEPISIPVEKVKDLVPTLRSWADDLYLGCDVELSVEDGSLAIKDVSAVRRHRKTGQEVEHRATEVSGVSDATPSPAFGFLPERSTIEGSGFCLDAELLNDAMKVRDFREGGEAHKHRGVQIIPGLTEHEAVIIRVGSWFRSVIMPVRKVKIEETNAPNVDPLSEEYWIFDKGALDA